MNEYEKERQATIAKNKKIFEALEIPKRVKILQEKCQNEIRKQQVKKRDKDTRKSLTRAAKSVRRSSRLKGHKPQYNELVLAGLKRRTDKRKLNVLRTVAQPKEEVYTEKHLKALGSYEKKWELFVDGYENGERIYDPVKGVTCHQCRQKTLAKHTTCSKCQKLKGCFCGDCLFMRYGENLDEVSEKSDWMCPVCRDICNCSFCRTAKGWAPTGNLFRKAVSAGYKSAAHYLIMTHLEDKENAPPSQPAKYLKSSNKANVK